MRKRTIGIASLVVIAGFLGYINFESKVVSAAVINVGTGAGNDTASIQDAIDNIANPGDTIYVHSGTYFENLRIYKTINLTGENKDTTIIDGGGASNVANVSADWVNITGFTITNGINGLSLQGPSNNNITGNNFVSNGIIIGGSLENYTSHNIPTDNIVNGKPLYYYKDCSGIDIDGIPVGQLILANCADVDVRNVQINNTDIGIQIAYSTNILIANNNISSNNHDGIALYSSPNSNIITSNNVSSNGDYGIEFYWMSSNNTITGNNVSNNSYGIIIRSFSNNSTIMDNDVSSNNGYGIFIAWSSNNRIFHNNIINNANQAYDFPNANSWNDTYPSGGNYWSDYDTPAEGCNDLFDGATTPQTTGSSDNICDSQYDIDVDSTDYYPLKNPWVPGPTPPSAPRSLQASAGDSHVNITWNAPALDGGSSITNYRIYRGTSPGGETFLTEIGNVSYYNDTSVTNGITYYYKVSAKNAIGEGPLSNEDSAIPAAEPTAPTSLTATAGDSYVNITWSAPVSDGGSSIASYKIYRGTTSGGETFLIEIGNILYYNDTSVTNEITYYYKVSAKNAVGEGPQSNEAYGTPATIPSINKPPVCAILSPSSGITISGTYTIAGTASDTDGTIQSVEIKIDDGSWIEVNGTSSWNHDWDTTVVSNGQHAIYARAYDGTNYSSEVSITITVDNPSPPPSEKSIFEEIWFWMLIALIVIIIALVIIIFLLLKRREKEPIPKDTEHEEVSEFEEGGED